MNIHFCTPIRCLNFFICPQPKGREESERSGARHSQNQLLPSGAGVKELIV